MAGASIKVLIANVIMLGAEYLVISDQNSRVACALGRSLYGDPCLARASPSLSYGFLSQSFAMVANNGITLQSPLTLDWVQLLAVAIIATNLWYLYRFVRSRRRRPNGTGLTPT